MECPSCGAVMVILELSGVEVDHCFSCGGVWLDNGELEQIMGQKDALTWEKVKKIDLLNESTLRCPICTKRMDKVYWLGDTMLILDRCPKEDGGLWFDQGELDLLLEESLHSESEILSIFKEIFQKK